MASPQPPIVAYRQPQLRICATFAATDGSCPESIDIEFGDDVAITGQMLTEVVEALAAVAKGRMYISSEQAASRGRSEGTST